MNDLNDNMCLCVCAQTSRWRGRRSICRGSGFTGGLHHLLLHLPSLSGMRTLSPALLHCLFILSALHFHTYFSFHFFLLSLSVFFPVFLLSLCVCVLRNVSVCVLWVLRPQNCLSPSPWTMCSSHWLLDLSLTLWVYTGHWECDCVWDTFTWMNTVDHSDLSFVLGCVLLLCVSRFPRKSLKFGKSFIYSIMFLGIFLNLNILQEKMFHLHHHSQCCHISCPLVLKYACSHDQNMQSNLIWKAG